MGTQVSSSALIEGMKFGEVPDTLDSVQNVQWVEYRSTNQLNGNVIDILIPGSGDFIDLRRSFLSVKFKVTKADGTALAATDHIGTGEQHAQLLVVSGRSRHVLGSHLPGEAILLKR